MGDVQPKRIYSTLDGEPELEESIEDFVVTLAERVDRLQDAQLVGDLEALHKQTRELCDAARLLGYPQLAESGSALVEACEADDPDQALARLVEITDLSRAIRRGHRGAF